MCELTATISAYTVAELVENLPHDLISGLVRRRKVEVVNDRPTAVSHRERLRHEIEAGLQPKSIPESLGNHLVSFLCGRSTAHFRMMSAIGKLMKILIRPDENMMRGCEVQKTRRR
jgi:hypothetical protein